LPEKQKNGSSNHGEPFFLGPLLTSPKGEEKEKKPLQTSPKPRKGCLWQRGIRERKNEKRNENEI